MATNGIQWGTLSDEAVAVLQYSLEYPAEVDDEDVTPKTEHFFDVWNSLLNDARAEYDRRGLKSETWGM